MASLKVGYLNFAKKPNKWLANINSTPDASSCLFVAVEFRVRCQGMRVGFVVDKTALGQVFLPFRWSRAKSGGQATGPSCVTVPQLRLDTGTREKWPANGHSDWPPD